MDKITLELDEDQGRELLAALVSYYRRKDAKVLVEVLVETLDEPTRSVLASAIEP